MLEAGENPGWVARQMRHTSAEMLWRRYARWWPLMAQSNGNRAELWWRGRINSSDENDSLTADRIKYETLQNNL